MTKILTWKDDIKGALYQSEVFVGPSMHTKWSDKFDCLIVYSYDAVIAVNHAEEDKDTWYLLTKKLSSTTSRLQKVIKSLVEYDNYRHVDVLEFPSEEAFKYAVIDEVGISI